MIGKEEIDKIKKCPLCGGKMNNSNTTMPFSIYEKIIIKELPAEICSDCGEAYMKSSIVDRVETLLDRLEDLNTEIAVVNYKAA